MNDSPKALQSIYEGHKANEPIILYSGAIRTRNSKLVLEGTGRVSFVWHPAQRVVVELEVPEPATGTFAGRMLVELVDDSITAVGEFGYAQTKINTRSNATKTCYYGTLEPSVIVRSRDIKPDTSALLSVHFHVANLPELTAPDAIQNEQCVWLGRNVLEANGWQLTLDRLDHWHETRDKLYQNGGFGITHLGKATRVDNTPFSIEEAHGFLWRLSFYLSYLRGRWSSIILPFGYSDTGQLIYQEWIAGERVTNWREDNFSNRSLDLGRNDRGLARFLELAKHPTWGKPIMSAIRWYVESNARAGGVEGAIILQMAAFELLSWTLFVLDDAYRQFSNNKYNERALRLKILDLLNWMEATREISEVSYPNLYRFAKSHGMSNNGPRVLVKIRDAYVHPKPSRQEFVSSASRAVIEEAHTLGQRYLQEALRKLFGYPPSFLSVHKAVKPNNKS